MLKNKKIKFSKQSIFTALAIIFFALIMWFGIRNLVFLIDNLNKSFSNDSETETEKLEFQREKFDNLNISS